MPIINTLIKKVGDTPISTPWNIYGIRSIDQLPSIGTLSSIYLIFDIPNALGDYPQIPDNLSLIDKVALHGVASVTDGDIYSSNAINLITYLLDIDKQKLADLDLSYSDPKFLIKNKITKALGVAKLGNNQLPCHIALWLNDKWEILDYILLPKVFSDVFSLDNFNFNSMPDLTERFEERLTLNTDNTRLHDELSSNLLFSLNAFPNSIYQNFEDSYIL